MSGNPKTLCPKCNTNLVCKYKAKMCRDCYVKNNVGENHPNFVEKNKCGKCGKDVYRDSKLCRNCRIENSTSNVGKICPICNVNTIKNSNAIKCKSCYVDVLRANSGENHSKWRVDKNKCIDCGKIIKDRDKRCVGCYKKNKALIKDAWDYTCKKCGCDLPYKSPSNLKNFTGYCIKCFNGELRPNYNPNKTHEQRVKDRKTGNMSKWRLAVYEKDNYTCQKCGDSKGGNLNAHHLFNYSNHEEGRHDVDNGITLCIKCHKAFHKNYGIKNNDLSQFLHFLNNHHVSI